MALGGRAQLAIVGGGVRLGIVDMTRRLPTQCAIVWLLSGGALYAGEPSPIADVAAPSPAAGNAIVQQFASELKGALERALAERGTVGAIDVCSVEAPHIAARLSRQFNAKVMRTATRVRNPANAPQRWQRAALTDFERRVSRGEKVETLEFFARRRDGSARYLRAIGTAPLCLACHGEMIAPETQRALRARYPRDQATGFNVGDLRGAFSIEWPADRRAAPSRASTR